MRKTVTFCDFSIRQDSVRISPRRILDVLMPYPKVRTLLRNAHMACTLNNCLDLPLLRHVTKIHFHGFIVFDRVLFIHHSNVSINANFLRVIMGSNIPIQINYDGNHLIFLKEKKLILSKDYIRYVVLAIQTLVMGSQSTFFFATLR